MRKEMTNKLYQTGNPAGGGKEVSSKNEKHCRLNEGNTGKEKGGGYGCQQELF